MINIGASVKSVTALVIGAILGFIYLTPTAFYNDFFILSDTIVFTVACVSIFLIRVVKERWLHLIGSLSGLIYCLTSISTYGHEEVDFSRLDLIFDISIIQTHFDLNTIGLTSFLCLMLYICIFCFIIIKLINGRTLR